MKIYTPDYPAHAGKWIYTGIRHAWQELGHTVAGFEGPPVAVNSVLLKYPEVHEREEPYALMLTDGAIYEEHLEIIAGSHKTFVYAQPNEFPTPWGTHPNFMCLAPDPVIDALNSMDNVYLWNFMDDDRYHTKWKKVHTMPLAYDSLNYAPIENDQCKEFDICFVGGWANNGFDEKRRIMLDIFGAFRDSGLKCAFFVEKNLSHEQECALLYSSKLTLNIHDAYQRSLGLDTNERTFKSLGLNGCLVSDKVQQINRLFPSVPTSLDAAELVQFTKDYLSLTEKELNDIKEENRQNILDNHTYVNRVQAFLDL